VKNKQSGITLVEILVGLAILSMMVLAVSTYTIPWIAREGTKSAVYDVQTFAQLARIEAVSRNRNVYFEVETAMRRLQVVDSNGSLVLHETTMPNSVNFAQPTVGTPVTLANVAGNLYRLTFDSDGTVTAGQGYVCLFGGNVYERASVFAAGAVQVENWNGSGWKAGS
jgi:Tfp pilus assembly protein FimT